MFSDLSQALVWAERVTKRGTVVVAVDGDDGTQLSRADLASHFRETERPVTIAPVVAQEQVTLCKPRIA